MFALVKAFSSYYFHEYEHLKQLALPLYNLFSEFQSHQFKISNYTNMYTENNMCDPCYL